MKTPPCQSIARNAAEFHCRRPVNRFLVQGTAEGGVLICAAANNLTSAQREVFIRYLCAEGFVTVDGEPATRDSDDVSRPVRPSVRWIVDPVRAEFEPWYARHPHRVCWYTIGFAAIFFTGLARLAFL